MKTSLHILICVLMCLSPTVTAAQAPQEQNPKFRSPILLGDDYLTSRQMTEDPLLRLSRTGPTGEDGIRLELTSLPLLNPGPSVFLDCPDPMVPGSGLIRFQPGSESVSLQLRNQSTIDTEILSLDLGSAIVAPYRPRISLRKPLVAGIQSAIFVEPSEDRPYLRYTSFGASGLRQNIAHTPSLNSFFDVFIDINEGLEIHAFSEPPLDLVVERAYDKATPKLSERIYSNNPGVSSFFDVFYDLPLGTETRSYGDPDFDLLVRRTYDKSTPKILDRIFHSDPQYLNSFFDIEYSLNQGTVDLEHKSLHVNTKFEAEPPKIVYRFLTTDPNYMDHFFLTSYQLSPLEMKHTGDDLEETILFKPEMLTWEKKIKSANPMFADRVYECSIDVGQNKKRETLQQMHRVTTCPLATPKLEDRISSTLPGVSGFFDIDYDLILKTESTSFEGLLSDIVMRNTYDNETHKYSRKIFTTDPAVLSFFDVFYELPLGTETRSFGDPGLNVSVKRTYEKSIPKILDRISSGNAGAPGFFDVFYDLNSATMGVGFANNPSNICYSHHFDPGQPSLLSKIESSDPLYLNSFFDIGYDLDLGWVTTKHHGFKHVVQYNETDWDFISRYASDDPLIPDFFDISYDLELGKMRTRYNDLHFTVTASEPSQICWKFASSLPGTPDFIDVCYDLDANEIITHTGSMRLLGKFDQSDVRHSTRLSTDVPTIPGFIEEALDISNQDLILRSTKAGVTGMPSMEMKYEYDALSRRIREVTLDESTGATLAVERRLLPGGSGLSLGGSLWVEGPLSSESGPLVLGDDTQLNGFLTVVGGLQVIGPKMFRIDHPLDPANKYLQHSCVESPDMMNVYNGNTSTDRNGFATVELPDYFEALNADYRYQLTCIGQFAQAIVAEKIAGNRFTIQTDKPHVEVSWQVTGVRKDPAAVHSGYAVEVLK